MALFWLFPTAIKGIVCVDTSNCTITSNRKVRIHQWLPVWYFVVKRNEYYYPYTSLTILIFVALFLPVKTLTLCLISFSLYKSWFVLRFHFFDIRRGSCQLGRWSWVIATVKTVEIEYWSAICCTRVRSWDKIDWIILLTFSGRFTSREVWTCVIMSPWVGSMCTRLRVLSNP